ncbi:hypothetical protein Leryth_005344 [Lithospermum erythrorhizon]|nr:hypothetical protein Leryth_005344 [Lithospermum erythrorhizon]
MAQQSHSSVESSTSETQKITAPYDTWKSPLTADLVSCSDKRLNGCAVDAHGRLFWLEGRPTEGGYAHKPLKLLVSGSYMGKKIKDWIIMLLFIMDRKEVAYVDCTKN